MADIEKIAIGGTTYNVSDVSLRTMLVRTQDFTYNTESGTYAAGKGVYHWIVSVTEAAKYCSRLFAVFRANIYRKDDGYHWTQIKLSGDYRNANNTASGGTGYCQKLYAIGQCDGTNGPKNYSLTCSDNIGLTNSPKWLFYALCGQSFSTQYHYLSLYFFNNPVTLPSSGIVSAVSGNWATIN